MKRLRSRFRKFLLVITGRDTPAFIARHAAGGDPAPGDLEVAKLLATAETMISDGNPDEARVLLASISRPRGIRLIRRKMLAKLHRKAGNRAASLAEWKLILAKVPRSPSARKKVRKLEPREAFARSRGFAATGDHAAAVREIEALIESRPKHPRAGRILIELLVAGGREAEAQAVTRRALLKHPANRKPLATLAGAFEAAGDVANTLRTWSEAADTGKLSVSAIIARAGLAKRKPATPPPAPANSDHPDAPAERTIMEQADEFFRLSDETSLFRLLATPAADSIRRYYEAKTLYQHNGLEEALAKSTGLLADPDFMADHGPDRESRRLELWTIRLRCLAQLGRHDEAYPLLEHVHPSDPGRRDELQLDLCWRRDPARGLDLVSGLWTRPGPSEKTSVLFCTLPLALDDPDRAAKHLRMDLIRRECHGKTVPNDLVLAAARIQHALGDTSSRRRLIERYFRRFSLESPVSEDNADAGFDSLAVPLAWRSEDGPLVSVIVTTFNAEKTVSQAVMSLLGQTHANTEIIVIDDASTDGTHSVLTKLAASDRRIRLFRNRHNVGTYVSKNFAMGAATGEYLMFHDADDWAHPRRIQRHLSRMLGNPDLAATTSDWIRMDESGAPTLRPLTGKYTHLNPGSMFCHVLVKHEIGFFDSVRIDADMDYLLRIRAHFGPRRLSKIAAPLTIGRFHAGSLTRSGLGAQNDEGFSKVRGHYRTAAFHWRKERILTSGSLHLAACPRSRDLPADREIKAHHAPEPVAHG